MDGQPVMIINLHLPCCDNDSQRENEIDIILKFIREAKLGNENYDLQPGTPIIITGDTNFVGNSDQVSALKSGDIFNNSISGPDFQIDWDTDGLKDLKPLTANTNTSYTWLSDWEGFSPGRLDYVFYSDSHLIQKNSFVIDTRELTSSQLDQNNLEFLDTNRASDHLPVIADFSLQVSITEDFSELIAVPYPNPAQDWITIDEIGLKQLIGLDGKVILQTYGNSLLLSGVKAGLYLIRITDEKGQSKVHKVLVAD